VEQTILLARHSSSRSSGGFSPVNTATSPASNASRRYAACCSTSGFVGARNRTLPPFARRTSAIGIPAGQFDKGAWYPPHSVNGLIAGRPVWVFSSGPIGTDTVDKQGRDVLEASRPTEFAEVEELIRPRGKRVFFGAFDPNAKPVGLAERFTRMMPAAKEILPYGDFRDWSAIEAWASEIARELTHVPAGHV